MANLDINTLETMMNVTIYVFVFLFGITIGSFLNVCILRLPRGESLITNNSHCMTCGTEIKRYDLIPVFSWLILRGRCRACGAKISPRYMLVESLTGFVFLGVFLKFDFMHYGYYPVMLCLFFAGLIVLCFQDIDNQEMCVSVLIYTFIMAAATRIFAQFSSDITMPGTDLTDGLLGMISVSGVLLVLGFVITPLFYIAFVSEDHGELRRIKKEMKGLDTGSRDYRKLEKRRSLLENRIATEGPVFGFGMGDVVLMAAGGLMLGLKATLTAGIVAILTGAVYAVILKAKNRNDENASNAFAFGPFLIIGLAVGAFTNGALLDMYVNMISRG